MSGWGLRALFAPGTVASRTANIASRWILNLMNLKTNSSRRAWHASPVRCLTRTAPFYYGVCRISSVGSKGKGLVILVRVTGPYFVARPGAWQKFPRLHMGLAGLLTLHIRSPRQNHQDRDSPAARPGPALLSGACLPNSPRLLDSSFFIEMPSGLSDFTFAISCPRIRTSLRCVSCTHIPHSILWKTRASREGG
jgi:hypothetical protein